MTANPFHDVAEGNTRHRPSPALIGLWVAVVIALVVWTHFEMPGWDLRVYGAAINSLHAGHDPYADAMAIQQAYHSRPSPDPNGELPYSYVYSPITLPLLRLAGSVPFWLSGTTYWLVYILAVLGQIWIALQFTGVNERRYFLYLAPAAAFFPGLLQNGTVLSGNIAYLLYFAIFGCALVGWRRGAEMASASAVSSSKADAGFRKYRSAPKSIQSFSSAGDV